MYASMNRTLVAGKEVRWQQLCALAQQYGFPGVDVDLAAAMRDGAEATKDLLAGRTLRPAVVGCPVNFRRTEEEFQEGMRQLPEAAAFASAIGCPRMTVWVSSSTNQPRDQMWRLLVARFSAIAKVLADYNVRFGLEYLGPLHIRQANPHVFAYRMADFLQLAEESGPNVGILLDTWHWHHAGDTLDDIVKAGKHRIVHVQVADTLDLPADQIRDNERLFAGEGIINLKAVFETLRRIGYTDGVSPKIFGRGIARMPLEESVKMGYDSTVKVLRSA